MNQKDQDKRITKASRNTRIYALIDTDRALQETKEKIGLKEKEIVLWPGILKIAASIVIAVGVAWSVYLNQIAPKWTTYASGEEIKEYKLPDGSLITLNEHSILKVNQNMSSKRRVRLEGEAFFDVKRDEARPFTISTGGVEAEVLGTSFNILSNPSRVEVSVNSGKVRVSEQGQKANSATLIEGEAVLFTSSASTIEKYLVSENYLAWKTGVYRFNETPVKEALKLLANSKGIQVQFKGQTAENCKITSVFDNQTWEEITKEFGLIHSLEFSVLEDGMVEVKGGHCE